MVIITNAVYNTPLHRHPSGAPRVHGPRRNTCSLYELCVIIMCSGLFSMHTMILYIMFGMRLVVIPTYDPGFRLSDLSRTVYDTKFSSVFGPSTSRDLRILYRMIRIIVICNSNYYYIFISFKLWMTVFTLKRIW